MQKRKRGRPAQRTPRLLLVTLARTMLVRRVKPWRAACIVADSPDGTNFNKLLRLKPDSLANRLHREFLPMAQTLLAEAGRSIESDRRWAKRLDELRNSGGVLPLGSAFVQTPVVRSAIEAEMRAYSRHGVAYIMTPDERAIEQAKREYQRQNDEIERRQKEFERLYYRSTLIT